MSHEVGAKMSNEIGAKLMSNEVKMTPAYFFV
jgi:hypothetical protein